MVQLVKPLAPNLAYENKILCQGSGRYTLGGVQFLPVNICHSNLPLKPRNTLRTKISKMVCKNPLGTLTNVPALEAREAGVPFPPSIY